MMYSDVANLVELIPYAALLYSREETILAANGMFCELTGYSPAELAHLRPSQLTVYEDQPRDDAACRQLLDGPYMELAYEKSFIAKSGEVIRCEVALKRLMNDGQVQYVVLARKTGTDQPNDLIMDSLHGASELVLHAIDEGFILLDRDFRIRCINDEALRIDGRPRSALIGRTHWEAWPGSEDLPLAYAYRQAMRERVNVCVEQLYHHRGEDMWLEARAFPFGDSLALFYKNITQRKLAERAIRESETKFRTIADAIPQIVWSARPDGFHDYFNRQWYDYTGMSEHASEGHAWLAVFHPDDQSSLMAKWHHSLATGDPYEVEFRLRHHSGQYRWTLGRALPLRDAHCGIVRWMGTSTDIHERVMAQSALKDTQTRLEAALTAAAIGTWTWDIPADRVHADRNLAAMFSIAPEDADNQPLASYLKAIHPDDADGVREEIERSVASGEPSHKRFRVLGPGGAVRFVEARGTIATGKDGKPTTMSGAVLDVTRQHLAEEARQISESKFRTLAENIPQLAWMADSDGDIFWYNNRWFEYTGTTFDEMQGWGWMKVHHPEHVDRVVALYRKQIVEDQCIWEDTFPLRGADGQYRWFLSRAMPIRDKEGNVVRWLGTNTDITLQREAEQALQQANQRKDDFLALLAHELRNPLAPISTAAQLLKTGAANPANIKLSSDIIDRQVRHMTDLVNDVMDVSRVTRGVAAIDQEEVPVAQVINTAVEQSRPLMEARRQALVVDMRDDGGKVLGDSTRLVQVLTNLLNNAAKYTQQGGRITLTVDEDASQVRIAVSDNGMGIDAALLPHVFELFTQAERTPDRAEGGLGLGLALVKSIVALHHGQVTASSAGRGTGSTFTVTLPLLWQQSQSDTHAADTRPLHILLVDRADDGDRELPAALQAQGHMVALCPDEACALTQARDLHPDAVLIRTDMPGVEGYALAQQLRALHPDEHATYIALNGSGQSHDKVIARGAGFDYQLERPVALASLKRVLPAAFP
ncbi:hypothetical protein GCM10027277_51450 [Pseudoduganella ginsengisoli]|uniref:histidine kinase n=1 Tax=Pseudoduganella ginsengisoli TaxID=1462440 RepID=A0A6L6Q437_9BURK|nr:PAS domain S-box protein [Pseudoduganella ginsengisoli]MTW04365.1 PAS domain S-box protein [Pseudoduganella ginsengisoli]